MDWGSMGPGEEWVNSAAHEPEPGKTQERSKSVNSHWFGSEWEVWLHADRERETEEVDGQTLCDISCLTNKSSLNE